MRKFLERPPLKEKSKVSIVRAEDYTQAEKAVRRAVDLLGGIGKICKRGDKVMIKPNMIYATKPEEAETTHPAIVMAMVKLCKEAGASVKLGEQTGWHCDPELSFIVTGIKEAALAAGAEEIVNWDTDEYVTVNVPNPRSYARVMLPKSLMDADVIIHIPKMKTNAVQVATLGIKGWIGALHNSMRTFIHKNSLDNGFSTTDVVKALGSKLKLTLIDGIDGMEGSGPHAGLVCHPKVIVASQDVVAFNAVTCQVMGFHPLEIPATQVAAKDGLGTADMDEIEVLGERIEDVVYPFKRAVNQYVNHYQNVKEFVGGACQGCYWMFPNLPAHVDPNKKYGLVAGARALIGDDLSTYDEVHLIGICASAPSHQLPGFKERVAKAKKIVTHPYCPGYNTAVHHHEKAEAKGDVFETPDLLLGDMCALWAVPDVTNPDKVEAALLRKENRQTPAEFRRAIEQYYGSELLKHSQPALWPMTPLKETAKWQDPIDRELSPTPIRFLQGDGAGRVTEVRPPDGSSEEAAK
jgi:uncharacterized protein (DUF362 family)